MLRKFNRDDLDKLWSLVKERSSYEDPGLIQILQIGGGGQKRALWVELKRLFEPDTDDILWKLQRYMHDPLTWRLYDTCGVHHVSTDRGHDIFMLVEKDYPLSKGVLMLMLVNKLLVEQSSEMANELLKKIFILANRPRQGGLLGIKGFYKFLLLVQLSTAKRRLSTAKRRLSTAKLKWRRHVIIVHQTKDLHEVDYTQLYDFLKYNQVEVNELRAEQLARAHDPLALMANSNNPYNYPVFHQDQPSHVTYMQQPQPNNNYIPQPSFNQNYMQQPMLNPEDISDPTTAMNMTLVLMAKAFKLNYSTPTNNNQRISSNPRNRQIAQPGMNLGQDRQMQMIGGNGGNQFRQYVGQNVRNQNGYNAVQNVRNQVVQNAVQNLSVQNVGNQNGLIVVPGIANQNVNGNVVAARAKGNGDGNGNNGNWVRCYNCKGMGYLARNCIVRPRRRDAAYLQTQLLIAQKEEVVMQLQAEEFDLMAAIRDLDEIEEVNANCILMANLQQASTSGYDSDGSAENDNNVISAVSSVEQCGGTVEQNPTTVEETRAYFESLYNNLAIEVEKVNTVNRKMKETNADLTTELARYKNQENSAKTITTLNEEITNLNNQLSKEKSTVSFLQQEKKKLKFDFKICKDELLDKQIQLENKIKELDNILLEVVEKLLEEEMLVGSSNYWVKVMLIRMVILVCSQLKRMRVIVSSFVKSMKSCFGGMMMIFGFFDGLEMEAFGEAMEVDNDWAIAGEMLEFLDTFGIVGFSERYNRVNIVEDERLEWSKDFNKAMLIDVVEASVKVKLHNTHGAGSSDCPQCLHTGRYAQWRSRFLRYIDTKTNGDALRKCILDGPYIASTVVIQVVPATKNSLAVLEHTTVETILNISPVNKAHFETEKEAILLVLNKLRRIRKCRKNLALIAKYFKKLYKPTNNNLRTSSNTKNYNVDTAPRYKNDNQTGQFRNQRIMTVAGARDTIGGQVVKQSGIQCLTVRNLVILLRNWRKLNGV
ncbi:integrase, catalytic region, zinc finger, CCHC-type containing protein [Tanacetum coccineum]|uniref:Integrase, catalytic region, zinc finger, CCHC-type containing protein n=1 Tax=Tanacetum coccineum TaxID=301880 RepID=A0ABQ4WZW5_9ASTR